MANRLVKKRTFAPVKRCTQCRQSEGRWEDLTDAQTGTAYIRCRDCGAHYRASAAGYLDWSTGVFMNGTAGTVGSEWTQKAASTFFGRPSDVTQD